MFSQAVDIWKFEIWNIRWRHITIVVCSSTFPHYVDLKLVPGGMSAPMSLYSLLLSIAIFRGIPCFQASVSDYLFVVLILGKRTQPELIVFTSSLWNRSRTLTYRDFSIHWVQCQISSFANVMTEWQPDCVADWQLCCVCCRAFIMKVSWWWYVTKVSSSCHHWMSFNWVMNSMQIGILFSYLSLYLHFYKPASVSV